MWIVFGQLDRYHRSSAWTTCGTVTQSLLIRQCLGNLLTVILEYFVTYWPVSGCTIRVFLLVCCKCIKNIFSLHLLRCLLSKKAGPVMNIIKEIFTTIHKFHFQLTSSVWEGPVSTAHAKMCETHKRFHQRAQFLFTGKNHC